MMQLGPRPIPVFFDPAQLQSFEKSDYFAQRKSEKLDTSWLKRGTVWGNANDEFWTQGYGETAAENLQKTTNVGKAFMKWQEIEKKSAEDAAEFIDQVKLAPGRAQTILSPLQNPYSTTLLGRG